jgi:hypothetical protein
MKNNKKINPGCAKVLITGNIGIRDRVSPMYTGRHKTCKGSYKQNKCLRLGVKEKTAQL